MSSHGLRNASRNALLTALVTHLVTPPRPRPVLKSKELFPQFLKKSSSLNPQLRPPEDAAALLPTTKELFK